MKKTTVIFSLLSTSLFFAQGKCPFNFDSKPANTPTATVQETQPMVEQSTPTQTMNVSKPITPNTNKDWWPNQLNLDILRQHDNKSNQILTFQDEPSFTPVRYKRRNNKHKVYSKQKIQTKRN